MNRISNTVVLLLLIVNTLFAVSLDEAGFRLGKQLFDRNNFVSAAEEFETIIKKYPDSAYYTQSLLYAGKCWYKLHHYNKAILRYGQVLIISRDEISLRQAEFGLAMSHYQRRDWIEAERGFAHFVSLYSDSPVVPAALYYASFCAKNLGKFESRKHYQDMLVSSYPNHPYARKITQASSNMKDEVKYNSNKRKHFYSILQREPNLPKDAHTRSNLESSVVRQLPNLPNEIIVVSNNQSKSGKQVDVKSYCLPRKDIQNIREMRTNVVTIVVTNQITNKLKSDISFIHTNIQTIEQTNLIEVLVSNEIATFVTNVYNLTNQVVITNIWTDYKTNRIKILTNEIVRQVQVIDTNWIEKTKLSNRLKSGREEIERLQGLVELKAKLLELKQKMIESKEKMVLTNGTNID